MLMIRFRKLAWLILAFCIICFSFNSCRPNPTRSITPHHQDRAATYSFPTRQLVLGGSSDIAQLKTMLEQGADVNFRDRFGKTPIMVASEMGHEYIAEILVDHGADVNLQSQRGLTALMFAAMKGHENIVKLLVDHDADVNLRSRLGRPAHEIAARNGHDNIVKILKPLTDGGESLMEALRKKDRALAIAMIKKGANANFQEDFGYTPLMLASQLGYETIVTLLIKRKVKVSLQAKNGWTALMFAAREGHEHIVATLIQNGANVNHENIVHLTPLMVAARAGRQEVVKQLLQHRVSIDIRDHEGNSALDHATQNGHEPIVQILEPLIYKQIVRSEKLQEGDQELFIKSAENNRLPWVKLLINKGINVNFQNGLGSTSLIMASTNGHLDMVKLLVANGGNLNLKNQGGETPLMKASEHGHLDIVKLLVDKGAKVDFQDAEEKTALDRATQNRHEDIVTFLTEKSDKNKPMFLANHTDAANPLWYMYIGDRESLRRTARRDLQRYVNTNPILQLMVNVDQAAESEVFSGLMAEYILVKTQSLGLCGEPGVMLTVTKKFYTKWVDGYGNEINREFLGSDKQSVVVPVPFGKIIKDHSRTEPVSIYAAGLRRMLTKSTGCKSKVLRQLEDNMLKLY